MRLATIVTPSGPRLHVRGRSGYVDVGEETGDPGFASLAAVLRPGPPAWTPSARWRTGTAASTARPTSARPSRRRSASCALA